MSAPRLLRIVSRSLLKLWLGCQLTACGGADAPQASLGFAPSGGACGNSVLGEAVRTATAEGKTDLGDVLFSEQNRVVMGPLVDGREIGDALFDLVASARQELLIEIFNIDERTWLAARLRAAIAALPPTIPVYILSDRSNNRFLTRVSRGILRVVPESSASFYRRMKAFFPFSNVHIGLWDNHGNPTHIIHSKAIVVDGRRAMVMDTNLQQESDPIGAAADAGGWHQRAIIVEGAVGGGLRREFAGAWQSAQPGILLPHQPEPLFSAGDCLPMTLLPRDAAAGEDAAANRGYAALFRAAVSDLKITTPNLNDAEALAAISDATARARVRVILSKGFHRFLQSIPGQGGSNGAVIKRLARAAAIPCNLEIRWFAKTPQVAVMGNGALASHSKWASADGDGMILGSQNLDTQSWAASRELSVFIDDPVTTRAFDRVFEDDWSRAVPVFRCPASRSDRGALRDF